MVNNIENKSVYIPQIDGKDLWISNYTNNNAGYSLVNKDGENNIKRYKATFDYSLDLIKLEKICSKMRDTTFAFKVEKKRYTNFIINVTFEYSVKEFNRNNGDIYVKIGYKLNELTLKDCICEVNDEIVAIKIGCDVENIIDEKKLGKYFFIENKQYKAKQNIKSIVTVANIRKDLYNNGFICNGVKYVKWKRSSGSARVGKCLFIDEILYKQIHEWELCGLNINYNDNIDLAAMESYISLTSSSIIDTIKISPKNILIINDYDSIFEDNVVSVDEEDGELVSTQKRTSITNSIWDGQGIIDKSLMGKYSDKGMLLLRNRFFKCCCFNGNIQEWFKDNGISNVSQLNGFTLAKDISEVKLITTPNSIKYLKFSSLEKWFELMEDKFGVVKYEKPTHHMNGKLVQSHYQLINTIQLSKSEINELLKPTFNLMRQLKGDPSVLRYWIDYNVEDEINITPIKSKTDVIYKMMSINDKFCKTKLYYDFRTDFLKSFTKNLKCGHVLIEGNYSTICGNPIEMLQSSIGIFNGLSQMEKNCIYTTRFNSNERLLGSRSPHITISNVLITENRCNENIKKYMNPTNEIVYINSIEENILHKLAGCDMDSDSMLITNNKTLIQAAERNDKHFKVAVCNVSGSKTQRKYNPNDCAELDIKTSKNLIGDIINFSQELNTLIWDMIANGKTILDVQDIYLDVCKLSIMSGIEIDKAKKEFVIDNAKELSKLRDKYKTIKDGKSIKPNFFAHLVKRKGYYNADKKTYIKYKTSMDYLQTSVNSFRISRKDQEKKHEFIKFSDVINQDKFTYDNVNDRLVFSVLNKIEDMNNRISAIFSDDILINQEKHLIAHNIRQDTIEEINNIDFNNDTMIALLKNIEKDENKKFKRLIFYTLFGYPNASFYNVIINSKQKIKTLEKSDAEDIEIFGEKFNKV